MSGNLLKHPSKIIAQSRLAAKNNGLQLVYPSRQPYYGEYYFNPSVKNLNDGARPTTFEATSVLYGLTRQLKNYREMCDQIETKQNKSDYDAIQKILNDRISTNEELRDLYLDEALNLVKTESTDLPVETCCSLMWAAEENGNSVPELYSKHLLPTIRGKLDYLSVQNITDLLSALLSSNSQDATLYQQLVDRLEKKEFSGESVSHLGWNTSQYEELSEKTLYKSREHFYFDNCDKTKLAGFFYRLGKLVDSSRLANILFFREWRSVYRFDFLDRNEELNSLVRNLEKLDGNHGLNTKALVQKIKASL